MSCACDVLDAENGLATHRKCHTAQAHWVCVLVYRYIASVIKYYWIFSRILWFCSFNLTCFMYSRHTMCFSLLYATDGMQDARSSGASPVELPPVKLTWKYAENEMHPIDLANELENKWCPHVSYRWWFINKKCQMATLWNRPFRLASNGTQLWTEHSSRTAHQTLATIKTLL